MSANAALITMETYVQQGEQFENQFWTILLSSVMNMVTQIIYLGRMEVRDWYYAV